MNNKNDENKIKKLKKEITELKNQVTELSIKLKENQEADEKRNQEIQRMQKEHHKENLFWNKLSAFGSLGTPLAMFLSFIGWWLKNKKKKNVLKKLGFLEEREKKD